MKYTKSKDGVMRANVRITLRFTKEELAEIKRLAALTSNHWKDWLESHATLGIEGEMMDGDAAYLQRYGKGDG